MNRELLLETKESVTLMSHRRQTKVLSVWPQCDHTSMNKFSSGNLSITHILTNQREFRKEH